jgi:hypothetical protein
MNANQSTTQINSAAAALWASAFVILALIIVQAGRYPGVGGSAMANMVADRGSYTLMTCDAGTGGDADPDEILCVIDSREQMMLVYDVEDVRKKAILLRDGYNLDQLFIRARQ